MLTLHVVAACNWLALPRIHTDCRGVRKWGVGGERDVGVGGRNPTNLTHTHTHTHIYIYVYMYAHKCYGHLES